MAEHDSEFPRPDEVYLKGGLAPAEAFVGAQLAEVAADVLRNQAAEALQYSKTFGYWPLRKMIAEWLTEDGVPAVPDDILIVSGAKQNLDMCARTFCSPGDSILVTAPTYMNGLGIFRAVVGARFVAVPTDEHGMDVDAAERLLAYADKVGLPLPKLIYDIPDFHNPLGIEMPEERREKLARLAARFGVPILEDNPYRFTRFEGEPLVPLKHFDDQGFVISTGSFAKILGPGLRLGWVHARRQYLDRIAQLKSEGATAGLIQMMVYRYYTEVCPLQKHLQGITQVLRRKRNVMLESLEQNLGGKATWSRPRGGYYIWCTLAESIDTDALTKEAAEAGVSYYPGSLFFPLESKPTNHLRLSYSYESDERLRMGVAALARAVDQYLSR